MSLGSSINQHNNPAVVKAAPAPEDVFVAWLLSRPAGADLVSEAGKELARLGTHTSGHPGVKRLHDLFRALVEENQTSTCPSVSRSTQ